VNLEFEQMKRAVQWALAEDIGSGDITSLAILSEKKGVNGRFLAKAPGIIAGLEIAQLIFCLVDERVEFVPLVEDGDEVEKGDVIATITGLGQSVLSGERVALNFLQRMSGIATMTLAFVTAVQPHRAIVLDTRKTVPGLRLFDKTAVRLGGGQNHRFGLYDMALIKENHIAAAGSITQAVQRVRECDEQTRPIEVEVTTLTELKEAVGLHVDRIMLDNMSLGEMREAVTVVNGRVPLEASGNVNLQTIKAIAATGVNYISVGALTHSVQALDISLLLERPRPEGF
jgi:nicotinate-nucleotide pyrophosphorylase (carboxylating)